MKKSLLVLICTALFIFTPVNTKALEYNNINSFVEIAATNQVTSTSDIDDWSQKYNKDQNCNTLLGNPDDANSVAWLLKQLLKYGTIVGILLVVVLSSVDFAKVIIKSDDDAMQGAIKKLGYRLILAGLLFFLPTITNAILDIFNLQSDSTCGMD